MITVVVLPVAVDRLGDSKIQVRDQASETILKLMVPASHPQVYSHTKCVEYGLIPAEPSK